MNLSDTLYDQVKILVEKGLYKSFESFLEIAAFNQLAMERGATPAEIVERGHRKVKDHHDGNGVPRSQQAEPVAKAVRSAPARIAVEPVARLAPDEVRLTDEDYELAFKRLALPENLNYPEPIAATPRRAHAGSALRPSQPPVPP
jgi:hypothetical protein